MPEIHVGSLVKEFGDQRALDRVSFDVADGELFTLLGPSGCGKSTTLMSIAGFQTPEAGRIAVGDEPVRGSAVDVLRRPDLLHDALVHDQHPVAHRERLVLVVGDEDRRQPEPVLEVLHPRPRALAQLRVEVRERLVEQQHRRRVDERPRQRDALLLAAGELVRVAALVRGHVDELEHLPDARGERRALCTVSSSGPAVTSYS